MGLNVRERTLESRVTTCFAGVGLFLALYDVNPMRDARRKGHPNLPRTCGRTSVVAIFLAMALLFVPGSISAQRDLQPSERTKQIPGDLAPDEAAVAHLYLEVLPAVVAVYGELDLVTDEGVETMRAHGSGVVVSDHGRVLTAAHLLRGQDRVLVGTQDGLEYPTTTIFLDEDSDLALLEISEPVADLATATLGDSDYLAVGQRVMVIGSPFGLVNSLSVGRISGFRQTNDESGQATAEFIQTDAAINMGNSGGPLFDSAGRLVAIASSYWTTAGGSAGIGFAVTINTATELLEHSTRTAAPARPSPEATRASPNRGVFEAAPAAYAPVGSSG
ncbi:MAG: trypsin-like peptidase domain-containing protein [Acidobacteriota bacterium]|nr:trypsin-like peptidase domain-containing protein [Acidobacteriota bacterium]